MFGKIERELKGKQQILQDMQNNIQTITDVRKERELREEIEVLMNREEIMWAQKAGNEWILQGDRNTKYFQTLVKQRRLDVKFYILRLRMGLTLRTLRLLRILWLVIFRINLQN